MEQIPDDALETRQRFEAWLKDAVAMGVVQPGWDIRWEAQEEEFWVRFTTATGTVRDLVDVKFVGYLEGMADMAAHFAKKRGR
ncbi:hypothetical protein ACIOHC_36165 [Streptomyces sp. NPDC088252]|uniref:hypothetical protein n=1 Tax=Streptomyces sp. NPDC088252 TaxID=3365845 RepID=UPI00381BA114